MGFVMPGNVSSSCCGELGHLCSPSGRKKGILSPAMGILGMWPLRVCGRVYRVSGSISQNYSRNGRVTFRETPVCL